MGIFYAAAEKSTLEDLLKWVEKNKIYFAEEDNYIIYVDDLVAEIQKRIEGADYD